MIWHNVYSVLSGASLLQAITKTHLYNFDPLKPHFYIVKLGFTGVYIIFLISAQKHRLWVLVRTASLFLSRNMKNIRMFYLKICYFLEVKFSVYLNRLVFVMKSPMLENINESSNRRRSTYQFLISSVVIHEFLIYNNSFCKVLFPFTSKNTSCLVLSLFSYYKCSFISYLL